MEGKELDEALASALKIMQLASAVAPGVAGMIAAIRDRDGISTDEVLARAGAALDDNDRKYLENKLLFASQ